MNKNILGALLVSIAATGAFAEGTDAAKPTATKKADYVCQNNSCKGKADCSGFGNDSCKGHNECKGQGIVKAKNAKACAKKGGLWVAKK